MFRTATGQTGKDAYINEATAIANAQRDLDDRLRRLCSAIHSEHPELLRNRSDWNPRLAPRMGGGRSLAAYLSMTAIQYSNWLRGESS